MNPLRSISGTIISGIVLSVIIIFVLGRGGAINPWEFWVWVHVLVGITWIGLLYYFNFVQVPGMAQAKADGTAPGISKHIAPRALLWFRWAALATWITGALALEAMHIYTLSLHDALPISRVQVLLRPSLSRPVIRSLVWAPGWEPSCCSMSGF